MTLAQGLLIALARCAVVAPAAALLARPIAGQRGRFLALLMIALWLTPTVVVGYAYSDGPLSLARHPWWNELLYSALLCAKALPIAVAANRLSPAPPLSPQALFLRTLAPLGSDLRRRRLRHAFSFAIRGPWRPVIIAAAATFLLTFGDFELASLMNASAGRAQSAYSWTIWLHEAHQLYLGPGRIVTGALLAAGCQMIVLAGGLWLIVATRHAAAAPYRASRAPSRAASPARQGAGRAGPAAPTNSTTLARLARAQPGGAWGAASGATLLVCVIPGCVVFSSAVEGIVAMMSAFQFGDELAVSLILAAMTTAAVVPTVKWLQRRSMVVVLLCCLPGLLGAMVLAMLIFTMIRWPALQWLIDTPLPLLAGLALLLLPPAVLLRRLFDGAEPGAAVHLARLLRASPNARQRRAGGDLLWRLRGASWFWLAAFVFVAACFELVVAVTLMPAGMTPLIVQLYNQMHFGHRALLSAGVVMAVAVPVAIVVVVFGLTQWRSRLLRM